jgi:DNA mismatch repair ATPase MutS
MGMIVEAKRIKEIHSDYLILYKSGSFYKVFGKDAYIVAAVFNYNIKIVDNNVATCGFPLNSIMKVRSEIEDLKINYMIIEPRNNYDIDVQEDFKNLNNYQAEFEKSYSKMKNKKKINHIVEELILIIERPYFKDTVRKINCESKYNR